MRCLIPTLALSLSCLPMALGCEDCDTAQTTPQATVEKCVSALRENDMARLLQVLTGDTERMAADWDVARALPADPEHDALVDFQLAMVSNPEMQAMLVQQMQGQMAELPSPQELGSYLSMGAMFAMAAASQNPALANAPELGLLQELIPDLQAWLSQADYQSREKAAAFAQKLLEGIQSLEIGSLAELRALDFSALTNKMNQGMSIFKEALEVYGIALDDFLDSVEIGEVSEGEQAHRMQVQFTMFGKPRSLSLRMVHQDGQWIPALVRDLQDVNMGNLMGNMPQQGVMEE